jgi:hypothetical protein
VLLVIALPCLIDSAMAAPPTLVVNQECWVEEDATVVLSSSYLEYTDPDTPPDQIVYTITNGWFFYPLLLVNGGLSGETFTQADINAGLVTYQYQGPENREVCGFEFSVSDGTTDVPGGLFMFRINLVDDPPVQTAINPLIVPRNCGTARLSGYELSAHDVDSAPFETGWTILQEPVHGTLLHNGSPLQNSDVIYLQQIYDGEIAYEHDGGADASDNIYLELINSNQLLINLEIQIVDSPSDISTPDLTDLRLSLDDAWPNPFNPSTEVSFKAPPGDETELSVFDIQGRKVATLFKGRATGASQSVVWKPDGLPSGVYLLRLTGHGREVAKKVTLLK